VNPKEAELFYSLYFAMTGMHALHMIIGCGLFSSWPYSPGKDTTRRDITRRSRMRACIGTWSISSGFICSVAVPDQPPLVMSGVKQRLLTENGCTENRELRTEN